MSLHRNAGNGKSCTTALTTAGMAGTGSDFVSIQYADASTQTEEESFSDDEDDYSSVPVPEDSKVKEHKNELIVIENNRSHDRSLIKIENQTFEGHGISFESLPEVTMEPTAQNTPYTLTCAEQIDRRQRDATAKRYWCDICNKSFSSSSTLAGHQSVHTGVKPFQCEYCQRRFRQMGNLANHIRTHIGLKPYKCDVCDKRFSNSSNVAVHMRTHTGEKPFKCDICHKMFSQFAHLRGHKRTHTGEAPFQCDICQKRFNNPSNLTTHKRIHGGERPYQCNICNKTFKQSGHLSSHRKSHTQGQALPNVKLAEPVTTSPPHQNAGKVIKEEKQ